MHTKLHTAVLALAFIASQASPSFATSNIMPKSVVSQIQKIEIGPSNTCTIAMLTPSFFGTIPGITGKVAVAMISFDTENCGGAGMAPPVANVIIYKIDGARYQKIDLPAPLKAVQVDHIVSVIPHPASLTLKVVFHGPNDPLCCAKTQGIFGVAVQ